MPNPTPRLDTEYLFTVSLKNLRILALPKCVIVLNLFPMFLFQKGAHRDVEGPFGCPNQHVDWTIKVRNVHKAKNVKFSGRWLVALFENKSPLRAALHIARLGTLHFDSPSAVYKKVIGAVCVHHCHCSSVFPEILSNPNFSGPSKVIMSRARLERVPIFPPSAVVGHTHASCHVRPVASTYFAVSSQGDLQ